MKIRIDDKTKLNNKYNYNYYSPSLIILVATNLFFSFYFIYSGGGIKTLVWVYWFQSIFIGIFNFFRILKQQNFYFSDFYINNKAVEDDERGKKLLAYFFLVHYGGFHFVYMVFMIILLGFSFDKTLLIGIALFGVNHLLSFLLNYKRESLIREDLGEIMFRPYPRIIPMHLIIFCLFLNILLGFDIAIFIFVILKVIADISMHIVEHRTVKT